MGDAYITRRGGSSLDAKTGGHVFSAKVIGKDVSAGERKILSVDDSPKVEPFDDPEIMDSYGSFEISDLIPGTTDEVFIFVPTAYYNTTNPMLVTKAKYARFRLETDKYTRLSEWGTVDFSTYDNKPSTSFVYSGEYNHTSQYFNMYLDNPRYPHGIKAIDDRHFLLYRLTGSASGNILYPMGWDLEGNSWNNKGIPLAIIDSSAGSKAHVNPDQLLLFQPNIENSFGVMGIDKRVVGILTISSNDSINIVNSTLSFDFTSIPGALASKIKSVNLKQRKFRYGNVIFQLNSTYTLISEAKLIDYSKFKSGVIDKLEILHGISSEDMLFSDFLGLSESTYVPMFSNQLDDAELIMTQIPFKGINGNNNKPGDHSRMYYAMIDWTDTDNPTLIKEGYLPTYFVQQNYSYIALPFFWSCGNNMVLLNAKILFDSPTYNTILTQPVNISNYKTLKYLGVVDGVIIDKGTKEVKYFEPFVFQPPALPTIKIVPDNLVVFTTFKAKLLFMKDVSYLTLYNAVNSSNYIEFSKKEYKFKLKNSNSTLAVVDNLDEGFNLPLPKVTALTPGVEGDIIDVQLEIE